MSPEMLQQTLTQAAQQLQAQMQPTAQDTGGLKQASTKSKGPVLAVPAAQEAAAAQPKYAPPSTMASGSSHSWFRTAASSIH